MRTLALLQTALLVAAPAGANRVGTYQDTLIVIESTMLGTLPGDFAVAFFAICLDAGNLRSTPAQGLYHFDEPNRGVSG